MKTLQLTFATIFALIATVSFAGNNPYFIVEEEGDNYVMYLQIDDASAYQAVSVNGVYCVNGQTSSTTIALEGADMENFDSSVAKIHTLDNSCDYATYTVQVTDNNGDVWEYPSVQIQADNYDMAMAAK